MLNDQLLLRKIAGRESYRVGPGFDPVAHIAKVLLELVETLAAPQPAEVSALALATGSASESGLNVAQASSAFDNSGSIEVDAIALESPPPSPAAVADIIEGMLKDPHMARISKRQFATIAADRIAELVPKPVD